MNAMNPSLIPENQTARKGPSKLVSSFASCGMIAPILEDPFTMLRSITEIIAPVDAIATNPKLSFSDALLSFFIEEIPIESARIKGTARIPVVDPEASNEIARNSLEVNSAMIRISK